MAILSVQISPIGTSGQEPKHIYLKTNNTKAEVIEPGYLNTLKSQGFSISETDLAIVSTIELDGTVDVNDYDIKYVAGQWTLISITSSSMAEFDYLTVNIQSNLKGNTIFSGQINSSALNSVSLTPSGSMVLSGSTVNITSGSFMDIITGGGMNFTNSGADVNFGGDSIFDLVVSNFREFRVVSDEGFVLGATPGGVAHSHIYGTPSADLDFFGWGSIDIDPAVLNLGTSSATSVVIGKAANTTRVDSTSFSLPHLNGGQTGQILYVGVAGIITVDALPTPPPPFDPSSDQTISGNWIFVSEFDVEATGDITFSSIDSNVEILASSVGSTLFLGGHSVEIESILDTTINSLTGNVFIESDIADVTINAAANLFAGIPTKGFLTVNSAGYVNLDSETDNVLVSSAVGNVGLSGQSVSIQTTSTGITLNALVAGPITLNTVAGNIAFYVAGGDLQAFGIANTVTTEAMYYNSGTGTVSYGTAGITEGQSVVTTTGDWTNNGTNWAFSNTTFDVQTSNFINMLSAVSTSVDSSTTLTLGATTTALSLGNDLTCVLTDIKGLDVSVLAEAVAGELHLGDTATGGGVFVGAASHVGDVAVPARRPSAGFSYVVRDDITGQVYFMAPT
jgi:hypothetical protein